MISYRHADILNKIKNVQVPVFMDAEMGPSSVSPGYFIVFKHIESLDGNLKDSFLEFIHDLLSGMGYEMKDLAWYKLGLGDRSMVEEEFMQVFKALKSNSKIKEITNTFLWKPGTKVKVMQMQILFRG